MTIRQLPAPRWTVPGHSGAVAAGWKVYTYEPTSSTPKDTYTDSSGDTEHQIPIVLDSRGEAEIWWDGNYKVIVLDENDVPVWSVDNYGAGIEANVTAQLTVVSNFSFETATADPDLPDAWDTSTYTGGAAILDSSAGNQIHGAKALKFTSAGSGGGYTTSGFFEVQEAVVLNVVAAMKGTADVRNLIEVIWYDKDQSLISTTSIYDASSANPTSWTDQSMVATPPSNARYAKIRLTGCHSSDSTVGSTWFDNVRVSQGLLLTSGAQTATGVKKFPSGITVGAADAMAISAAGVMTAGTTPLSRVKRVYAETTGTSAAVQVNLGTVVAGDVVLLMVNGTNTRSAAGDGQLRYSIGNSGSSTIKNAGSASMPEIWLTSLNATSQTVYDYTAFFIFTVTVGGTLVVGLNGSLGLNWTTSSQSHRVAGLVFDGTA